MNIETSENQKPEDRKVVLGSCLLGEHIHSHRRLREPETAGARVEDHGAWPADDVVHRHGGGMEESWTEDQKTGLTPSPDLVHSHLQMLETPT